MDNECIFCKISSGAFNTEFEFEDDLCVVFKDIHPKEKTHFLIVPKGHVHSIAELVPEDETLVGHLLYVAKVVADKIGLTGYKLQINVGKDGGQEVFHLHVHLLSKF